MSEETKQRIIQAGAELVHRQGFNNTGLKDILRAAGVPKGSFYFYFDNKEAFGLEVIDYYAQGFGAMLRPILEDDSLAPLDQLRAVFQTFQSHFEAEGYARGCPLGNLGAEMSDLSEPFRAKLDSGMERMLTMFERILTRAHDAGDIPEDTHIRETAVFILEAWHGALTRMKVTKNGEPLDICHKFIFEKLLK